MNDKEKVGVRALRKISLINNFQTKFSLERPRHTHCAVGLYSYNRKVEINIGIDLMFSVSRHVPCCVGYLAVQD